MFQSATIKLTAWYVAILVAISLLFSFVIYISASHEVGTRLTRLQQSSQPAYLFDPNSFDNFRQAQVGQADQNLLGSLIVTNLCIWVAGGIGSYWLARRTLKPIEDAHEAQSRFTSDASHEFRTPLASMTTELEVALRDKDIKKGELREVLESSLEEVHKLTNLSHSLLQLSHLTNDPIEKKSIDLTATLHATINRFNRSTNRIQLDNPKSYIAYANQAYTEELLTILLDNALKYSPDDSLIRLSLIQRKHMVGFEITNTGPGIPAEALPHVFDRFYRSDSSRTGGEAGGHGLGLSLAKKIVELSDGELSVTSALNHATTFTVLLPDVQPQAKSQK